LEVRFAFDPLPLEEADNMALQQDEVVVDTLEEAVEVMVHLLALLFLAFPS